MYSSRGSGNYGQQSYPGQTGYGQNLGGLYSGNSVGGADSQHSMASRHPSMLGASQEADTTAFRSHSSSAAHYGGQYSSVYSSAALGSKPQGPPLSAKVGGVPSSLEGRGGYASAITDSPKYLSSDYLPSSNHSYGHRTDQLFTEKVTEYPAIDRRQYSERQSAYLGRDLQSETTGRFSESAAFGHQRHTDSYDRVEQVSLLRQEQLLKAQSLQSDVLDGSSRQNDYLAAKAAAGRHSTQDLLSYGVRVDADPRNVSVLNSSYSGQHTASILGAAPRRNVDDLIYSQSSSNPGYGVSLPPGRDYAAGKGLHGTSLESDYAGSMLTHSSHSRIDEHKDDRAGYLREFELREEERRRDRLRIRDKEREREKAREREREHDRERERERAREREWEREKERERERERERILERQRERDREFKRGLEIRRERTPLRVSKDRRGSSITKEGRPLRRDSPHREASHRHHSPVKEKRREYVCKVHSHSLIDEQRDYLSLDKRYPRLYVSPEFSKVVLNWPKEKLKLSMHTPVSFEHDFIEEGSVAGSKELCTELLVREPEKLEHVNVVWNAKIVLMSGLSKNALEELSSEKGLDDRKPHFCNILRFAILKKDRAFMAIGGPWKSSDGGDPSVDDASLVETALRYAKDITQLDLHKCQHWNRFLEIHYDRYGKDGLFSHKEVTVLFVPDLSDCLPSLNLWREQWLAHKKAVSERERHVSSKKETSKEGKEGVKGKEIESPKDAQSTEKSEKQPQSLLSEQADVNKKEKSDDDKVNSASEGKNNGSSTKLESKDAGERGEEAQNIEKAEQGEPSAAKRSVTVKPTKKKIVKKIVKQKAKMVGDAASKPNVKSDEKVDVEKTSDISVHVDQPSTDAANVKTFTRKKVIKKVGKSTPKDNKEPLVKEGNEMDCSEDKSKDNSDLNATVVQDAVVKTVKKKIIKRVPKRKAVVSSEEVPDKGVEDGGDKDEKRVTGDETHNTEKTTAETENLRKDINKQEKEIPKLKSKSPTNSKQLDSVNSNKADKEQKKDEKGTGSKIGSKSKLIDKEKVGEKDGSNGKNERSRDVEQSKDEKEKMGKDESKSKSNKEAKEKRKSEEPPRHPGLILQTKWSKDSKVRSLSLSLDSLLEYSDKDTDESTFELSLFAESLYEMLQYQMGCRILTFLQKLRIKFVKKRNQRKRQLEESPKEDRKKSSPKRPKTTQIPVENKSIESETLSQSVPEGGISAAKEIKMETENSETEKVKTEKVETEKIETENMETEKIETENMDTESENDEEPEEDPEEDPEEYEEVDDTSSQHNSYDENEGDINTEADEGDSKTEPNEGDAKTEPTEVDVKTEPTEEAKAEASVKSESVAVNQADESKGAIQENLDVKPSETNKMDESDKKVSEEGMKKKEVPPPKEVVIDKELLKAFRFFDRNRVGYIRVEDMRLIIHSLGKFLPHRNVKELVHSALLESSTGRDDRILYGKLVRMHNI